MSWRERLRRASFRGVPFHFEELSDQGGRANVRHDFVGVRKPFFEDLGDRPRECRIRAHLIGEDVLEQLDELLVALDTKGPGTLVHPTLGTFSASLTEPYRVAQSSTKGGLVLLELSFCESGEALSPSAAAVPGPGLEDLADQVAGDAAARFAGNVDVTGEPELARDAMAQAAGVVASALKRLELPASSQELAAWRAKLGAITGQGGTLAAEPASLATALQGVIADVEDLAGGKLEALEVYRMILGLPRTVIPGRGVSSTTANGNARATDNLTHFLAFAGAAKVAARAPWSSLDQAVETRRELLEESEDLEAELAQEDLQDLYELRGLLGAAVPPPDRGLPREREVVPNETVPSLALAYQLDGDVRGELDLVERNRPRNPSFVPGGKALEVLERV